MNKKIKKYALTILSVLAMICVLKPLSPASMLTVSESSNIVSPFHIDDRKPTIDLY